MPTLEQAQSWYPTDPVHGFDHVQRVYHLAGRIAQAEGADLAIVQAAALLHDAQDNLQPPEVHARETHQHASASFACSILTAEGWPADRIAAVQHCIRAHRFRDNAEPPHTLEAKIIFDADKLDAIGAIGVVRAVAYAITHANPPYTEPSPQFLSTGETVEGESHSAYHEYLFKLRKLKDRLYTPTARAIAAGRHREMETFFEQLAVEMRKEQAMSDQPSPVLSKIAYFQNVRGEVPNQELARQLAQARDSAGIQEIAAHLWDKNKNIQSDCLKVLYEIGYLSPDLIADYAGDFLTLLHSKNNRLVWGAMIGLAAVAGLRPDAVWTQVDSVMQIVEAGSVITMLWGVRALAKVAATNPERRGRIFPFLLRLLETCIPRDVPTHAESMLPAVNESVKAEFLSVLDRRAAQLTPSQLARLKKMRKAIP